MGVSKNAFARMWGKSHTAVNKAVASGRIPLEPDGTIDPDKAFASLRANTDPSQQRSRVVDQSFQQARTASEVLKARERRLRLQRLEGSLVPADILEDVMAAAFMRVRSHLLAVPRKMARTLAKMTDPEEVAEALEKLIHEALDELSETEAVAKVKRDAEADAA
ncbi:MAG TPA: hypothetical protein VF188_09160 [Longimicrobiales bacterium]